MIENKKKIFESLQKEIAEKIEKTCAFNNFDLLDLIHLLTFLSKGLSAGAESVIEGYEIGEKEEIH